MSSNAWITSVLPTNRQLTGLVNTLAVFGINFENQLKQKGQIRPSGENLGFGIIEFGG